MKYLFYSGIIVLLFFPGCEKCVCDSPTQSEIIRQMIIDTLANWEDPIEGVYYVQPDHETAAIYYNFLEEWDWNIFHTTIEMEFEEDSVINHFRVIKGLDTTYVRISVPYEAIDRIGVEYLKCYLTPLQLNYAGLTEQPSILFLGILLNMRLDLWNDYSGFPGY